jgi:hypothetical protein
MANPTPRCRLPNAMICPECKAEYRPGFTRCADCDVELVWEPAEEVSSPSAAAQPGDPNEDPYCSFWKGDDPRIHADLCEVLDEAGIPHNTVFRRDHLFNLNNFPAYQIGVPFSLFEKAENVVKEAFGSAEDQAVKLLEAPRNSEEGSKEAWKMPATLTPDQAENIPGPPNAGEEGDWYPEDADAQVWVGENVATDFLIAALHENGIRCRVERNGSRARLLVLPEDEAKAGEIVREVVEGKPPE